jgi:PhnB protein
MITTQVAIQPIPYLHFGGNCKDVIEFYKQVLNAKLKSQTTIGEMPDCGGDQSSGQANPMANEDPNLIVNAQLELPGGGQLYLGDIPSFMPHSKITGLRLTLNYPTAEEGEKVFRSLAAGGEVTMDWAPTFWAEKFGMVTDKFGVPWLINGNLR